MYHCGAVVKELLERADQPGSTPVDAVFCFFVSFLVSFFLTLFFFLFFFFILTADPAGNELGSIYILRSSPEFYFGKGISKALGLHTAQAYDQIKAVCSQDMSLLRNSRILIQFVVYCVFVSYDVNEH